MSDIQTRDENGLTPISAQEGKTESIQCLYDLGADIDVRDNDGCTPLDAAVKAGQTEAAEWLRQQIMEK